MSTPTGVTPLVADLQLMRDEIVKVAGVPFKRLLVYKLTVPLPLPPEGMALFAVTKGFTIGSVTTSLTVQHDLNTSPVLVSVYVEGDDGKYRNDIVAVEETSNNVLTIGLTESRKVKVAVQSMAAI